MNEIFLKNIDINTYIEFYIDNIINYQITCVTESIKIYIKNIQSNEIIKRETNLSVSYTSGNILNIEIKRSSNKNFEKTNYIINFKIEQPIEENSEIKIIIPKEIAENIINENSIII